MGSINPVPTPPPEAISYSRPSSSQAAADAIPILVDDTYHVFHLTTPPSTRHHPERLRSTWSRIRSKNLVDWERDVESVLTPGKHKEDPDADGVWTGAAVLGPDGRMNIFYTGYNLSLNGKQVILRTESKDRHGTRFEQPGRMINIVSDGPSPFEDIDFRDPYVFYNEQEKTYWMLVATRLAKGPYWSRGCVALLTSSNLDDWTIATEPLYSPNDMLCPECPELFSLPNGKWYLVYSRFHAPNAGTVYRVSDSPRGPFRIPRDGSHGRLDGRRWYAAKSCPKVGDPSKRIYFGWVGDYVDDEGKWLWGGDLGVPREVSADGNGYLKIAVAEEFQRSIVTSSRPFHKSSIAPNLYLCSVGATATNFPEIEPSATKSDIAVSFKVTACDAHSFGLMLQTDTTDKGHRLQFTPSGHGRFSVALVTDFPPLDDFWADQYKLHLSRPVDGPELIKHENVSLEDGVFLFLRDQVVEVFCGGRSLSFRLPMPSPNVADSIRRLGWFVEDGVVDIKDILVRTFGAGNQ